MSADISGYSTKYNEFTGRFLSCRLSEDPYGNIVFSPLSMLLLLSLAADSAAGKTRREINGAVGCPEAGETAGRLLGTFQRELSVSGRAPAENAGNPVRPELKNRLGAMIGSRSRSRGFSCETAACVRSDLLSTVKSGYRSLLQEVYGGELISGADLAGTVNRWLNEKTGGRMGTAASGVPRDALFCLMNAVAFEAAWSEPYPESRVQEEDFHGAGGMTARTRMMQSREKYYIENGEYTGFTKPYRGSEFHFMALLPKNSRDPISPDSLGKTDFSGLFRHTRRCVVHTKTPVFRFDFSQELTPFCRTLGIREVFSGQADFSPMSSARLLMEAILHSAFIDVNPSGTSAGAATMGFVTTGLSLVSETKEVCLDRPFIFAIMHEGSALPVFAGILNRVSGSADQ